MYRGFDFIFSEPGYDTCLLLAPLCEGTEVLDGVATAPVDMEGALEPVMAAAISTTMVVVETSPTTTTTRG
jgi:hypothetical protein